MCGMKLRYLLPCAELHRNDSGLVSVFGVLDYLWFPSFPGAYNLTVGLSLEAAPADIGLDILGELVITGPNGEMRARVEFAVSPKRPAEDVPATVSTGIVLNGVVFPGPGEYSIRLTVNGLPLGETTIRVIHRPPAQSPT